MVNHASRSYTNGISHILVFLLLFTGVLFIGAILGYALYGMVAASGEADLDDTVIRTTQVCGLLFALGYLHYATGLSRGSLGWRSASGRPWRQVASGFLFGLIILTALATSLALLGIHTPVAGRDTGAGALLELALKSVLTGLAVGVFEETLFRGALLGGLVHLSRNRALSVIVISLVYAAVHFIDYPQPGGAVGWLDAPSGFAAMLPGLFAPATLDAFLSLFILGLLLGMLRVHGGSILHCIGLHAGLVAMIKVSRYFYAYNRDTELDWLVSSHDHRLGLLAAAWLIVATLAYVMLNRNKVT